MLYLKLMCIIIHTPIWLHINMRGNMRTLKAVLPSLDKLAQKEDTVKITLALTKTSVEYFKQEAAKREVCYQVMIRNLIDEYVKHCVTANKR